MIELDWLKEKILSFLKGETRTKFSLWLENYKGKIEDILKEFKDIDSEKYELIFTDESKVKVDGFAGSGTSKLLFLRVIYLLSKGVNPQDILVILPTYNLINIWKKKIISFNLPVPDIKKIEDFFAELLERSSNGKRNIERVGRGEGFKYSSLVNMALPTYADEFYLKKFILFKKAGENIFEEEKFIDSYREYQIFLESNRFFDLGDLVGLSFQLLSEPEFNYKSYKHILVDDIQEYPYKVTEIFSFIGENLFFVGDKRKFPFSSIDFTYSIKNNFRFSREVGKVIEVLSGESIVVKEKKSFLRNVFYHAKDVLDMAKFVFFQIKYLKEKDNIDFSDIVVIFRDIKDFELYFDEIFKKNEIPFISFNDLEILNELKDISFDEYKGNFHTLLEMAEQNNFSRILTDWIALYEKNFPVSLPFKERIERIKITKEKLLLKENGVKILKTGDISGVECKIVIIPQFEENFYSEEDRFLLYRAISRAEIGIYLISPYSRKFKWYNVKRKISPLIKEIVSFFETGTYGNFISRILKWIG